jgi:1,4-dihydroxy-2-naphthoyl-CoA hydrolase
MDPKTLQVGLDATLGFEYEQVGPDRVVVSWTVDESHLQPFGILHGGVLCAVVESAASIGASLWFADRGSAVGVANHTNFLHTARAGDRLTATSSPIHRGRSQQLWLVEVVNSEQRPIARGEVRLQNLSR